MSLGILCTLSYFTADLPHKYPLFVDKQTEAEEGSVTSPRSYS